MDSVRKTVVASITEFPTNDVVVKAKILNHIELRNYLGVPCQKDIDECNLSIGTLLEFTRCGWKVISE